MISTKNKQSPKKIAKPKECAKVSTSKARTSEPTECSGREFPLLRIADNDRMLPRYSAILNRTEDDGVGMEDLDALQLELEALLSAVVVRNRVLREEIAAINHAEEKQRYSDKKNKPGISHFHKAPLSPGKRTKLQERPFKRLKDISAKSRVGDAPLAPLPIKFTKVKGIPAAGVSRPMPNIDLPDHEHNDQSRHDAPKIVLPKNDTPNKFWQSLEPYCSDISVDDIKVLDELLQEHENDADYQKVPPLGRHYSLRWAQEEMEDRFDANLGKLKIRPTSLFDGVNPKKQDVGDAGPLTQRLLSCLMEENIIKPSQDSLDVKRCKGGENTKPSRTLTAANASSLERLVRKELEEQGLLDPTEQKEPADDEILGELRRCQAELKVISNHNVHQLKRLRKLATEEVVRQERKKMLQVVDNEVIEIYKKINASKQKKKPPTKEEIEQAWKALRQRQLLLRQIDNI